MLSDSRAKIEFLKMTILKVKQSRQVQAADTGATLTSANSSNGSGDTQQVKGVPFHIVIILLNHHSQELQ